MYGLLCESDVGLDAFGNPKGQIILMESTGEGLDLHHATERARATSEHGRYGKVMVVELVIHEVIF